MLRLVLILGFLFLGRTGFAQLVENYDQEWVNSDKQSLVSREVQKQLSVNLETFPESFLRFEVPGNSTLFIEGKLWRLFQKDTVFQVPVYKLKEEFEKETIQLTVINDRISLGGVSLSVSKVLDQEMTVGFTAKAGDTPENRRVIAQPIKDFYFTSLLIILFLLAIYRLAYPYLLGVLLQPLAVINAEDFSESGSLQKFFSFDILFYLLIVGMMISQSAVTSILIFRPEWLKGWLGWDFASFMMIWLAGSFGMLILTILKFIGIRIISYLFDLGKSEFAHFFYLLRLIVIGFSAVILIGCYFMVNNFSVISSVFGSLMSLFFWFYVLGVFGLFLIMMNRLSFKKYHLFTYLCIAEIVPFLILSKWIMVLGQ